jgi:hypothetical protein
MSIRGWIVWCGWCCGMRLGGVVQVVMGLGGVVWDTTGVCGCVCGSVGARGFGSVGSAFDTSSHTAESKLKIGHPNMPDRTL